MPAKTRKHIKKIAIIIGTRPELIRFSPLIHELIKSEQPELLLVHTGQHYSDSMNNVFFQELNIPKPHINLSVGGLEPNEQVGKIIVEMGKVIQKEKPDVICVWGDTNSSLGVAIAANKTATKLCHLEAGCRSHDFRMAEEYNRILIDHLSDLVFPLSLNDQSNLLKESVHGKSFFLGDPLYDVFLENQKLASKTMSNTLVKADMGLALLTLHRAENVDDAKTLRKILESVSKIENKKIVFPIHPRTEKMIEQFGLGKFIAKKSVEIIPPLGYLEIMKLLELCDVVITDSGGLQKEAFFAQKACVTLRKSTEWSDTVRLGVNILLDPETKAIGELRDVCQKAESLNSLFEHMIELPYGDGHATKKIVQALIGEIS